MKAILLATLAAIVVQPFVFFLLFLTPMLILGADMPSKDLFGIPLFAALFAAPFIIVVGIPALLLLRYFNRLSGLAFGAVGFIAAALPVAVSG
jgi:hypothetical protein